MGCILMDFGLGQYLVVAVAFCVPECFHVFFVCFFHEGGDTTTRWEAPKKASSCGEGGGEGERRTK